MQDLPKERYSILIVDDEVANVDALGVMLEGEQYDVFRATGGEQGLEILEKEKIDLLLLDIVMPRLDGFETLSRLRVHKKTKDLPVIFLTGFMRDPKYMEKGFSLGVNEYLLKPIDPNELLVRVKSILRMTAAENKVKQLQADFFSMLVHDLRGPLTAVRAFTQLLLEEKNIKAEDRNQMVKNIEGASAHMLDLINDILDLSKLESQYVTLDRTPVDLKKAIDRSMQRMKPLAMKKSIALHFAYTAGPSLVSADESKIEQVMDNLLMNGIKFTNEGGEIGVAVHEAHEGEREGVNIPSLVVCVKDNGIGITAKAMPFIFDKYRQLVTSSTAAGKGTGLGLAICKNIVDAHGGKIWLESTEHAGSSFYFSLPLK
ncbi:MAG TPA: response regulator [Bacteroidota bacterium]|nr:response regulator [Bacteroidota bacterium]